MVNTTPASAWGVMPGIGFGGGEDTSVLLTVRRRHWVAARHGLDVAIGPVVYRQPEAAENEPLPDARYFDGIAAMAAFSFHGIAAATVELDTGHATPVMVGLRGENYITATAAAALLLFLLAIT